MAVYKRGHTYWYSFIFNGHRVQKSAKVKSRKDAEAIEKAKWTQLARGEVGLQDRPRYGVGELLDKLKANYELLGKASPQNLSLIKVAKEEFGTKLADDLTAEDYDRYLAQRLKRGAALATVNRVGQLLRRAYRLQNLPYPRFSIPAEQNARQGFFSPVEFTAVAHALPDDGLRDFARFAYLTGMRKSEIAALRWEFVRDSEIVLPGLYAKTGKSRSVPIEGDIEDLLTRREAARPLKCGDVVKLSQFIFHRGDGEPIREFRKSWATAVKKARCPEKVFHDLRRTACRDMIRAGTPQSVAMSISGHTTISTFLRYNITSDDDKRSAMLATKQYRAALEKKIAAIPG